MKTMPPAQPYPTRDQDEALEKSSKDEGFRSWTAQEATQLRQTQPAISPWRVVRWMLMVSVAIGLLAYAAFDTLTALSAAYGSLCVAIPAAILARGMTSPLSRMSIMSGAVAFMTWEMVKIGVSIGMLALAPSLIAGLNWPALLIGLILTMKVYFVAAIVKPKPAMAGKAVEAPKNLN